MQYRNRRASDAEVASDLLAYYRQHPTEQMSTCTPDQMVFRYRCVEAMLSTGIPMATLDPLRPLLERVGVSLCPSNHLAVFIPKVESKEMAQLIAEMLEQY